LIKIKKKEGYFILFPGIINHEIDCHMFLKEREYLDLSTIGFLFVNLAGSKRFDYLKMLSCLIVYVLINELIFF
jgi:hypothetical protein